MRSLTRRSALRDHSPFKFFATLSNTNAEAVQTLIVVNPGSATLPRNLVGVPGTVAILEIGNGGEVSAEIISLA